MILRVPRVDSDLFQMYFETVWYTECDDISVFSENFKKKEMIEKVMNHYDKDSGLVCFQMLCRAHDIIYDRDVL